MRQILFIELLHVEVTLFERIAETGQWLETSLKSPDDQFLVNGQPVFLRDIYGVTLQ